MLALSSCEGGDLYNVDAPDWLSAKIDSIANAQKTDEGVEGLEEDVYTVGATDYSTGWWAQFSKYYQIPEGEKWVAQFNLNINPAATNTYKNFALIICNDEDRGAANYKEYGAIRYDNQPSGNSEWGDYIDRGLVASTLTFETDTDNGVDKLGGTVTLSIDRTSGGLIVTMTNGTVTKVYNQTTPLVNLNADPSNTTIRAFLVPEGSFINFLGSTHEPIGGFTSKEDKQPLSMVLNGVPKKVLQGTTLEEAFANVTATVQFEQEVVAIVPAADLTFQAVPLNADPSNTTIRAFLVPEGSFINFLGSTHEPIGGFTSKEDKQPLSMVLNGVPKKVLQGTTLEEAFANVTATVQFEQEVVAIVPAADLTFQAVPGLGTLGTKTLVAVYNKTYKGEGAAQPVIGTAEFQVVDKMFTTLGATDNSSDFWSAHSEAIKVAPKETFVSTFTNYAGGANWNNFVIVLASQDGSTEYGVLRADNWGWGTGWAGEELASKCTPSGAQADWGAWLAAMDGAKVTVYVTNNGDGTADVRCEMLGTDGQTYTQNYIGLNTVTNPNDFYFHLTIDHCHLEFDDVLGAEDNSTAFWNAHSPYIKVPKGQTYTRRFRNYGGASNWNNFVLVLTNADGSTEYGVLRADNWGWGTGWAGEELASKCTPSGGQADWGAWLAAMDESIVTVSVTNNGNGTADVRCVMLGSDGKTYTQDYIGLNTVTDPDNFFMHFTIDGCHLVFE